MEEKIKANLEKAYTEFVEYKEFLKDKIKRPDEIRKEVAEKIKNQTDIDQIKQILFDSSEKQMMYQADFIGLQNRLFHTIENYKDLIEIPQEIKQEVENMKFIQIFKIKNGQEIVVSQEIVDQAKDQIKNLLSKDMEGMLKYFGE